MNNYKAQISKIKSKLEQAKKVDGKLEVFGADSHKYQLNTIISQKELDEFAISGVIYERLTRFNKIVV